MNTGGTGESTNRYNMKRDFSLLFITSEGGIHLLAVYSSKLCDKISFEHFLQAIRCNQFSSCLILLSKQDTKKPIRCWASFQIFFFSCCTYIPWSHSTPSSIKSPNNCYTHLWWRSFFSLFISVRIWDGQEAICGGHLGFSLLQILLVPASRFSSGKPPPSPTLSLWGLNRLGSSHPITKKPIGIAHHLDQSSQMGICTHLSTRKDNHMTFVGRSRKRELPFPQGTVYNKM